MSGKRHKKRQEERNRKQYVPKMARPKPIHKQYINRNHIFIEIKDAWTIYAGYYEMLIKDGMVLMADLTDIFWHVRDRLAFARYHKVIDMSPRILFPHEIEEAEEWLAKEADLSEKVDEYEKKAGRTYLNRLYPYRQMTWRMLSFARTMQLLEAQNVIERTEEIQKLIDDKKELAS
jgi:hypothetical protein